MLTNMKCILTLCLNSGGQNSDFAWSKMYDLIPRSLKSNKFGENYQESDFDAGNGRNLEKCPPLLFEILLCINRADRFHQYVFVLFCIIVIRK